MRLLSLEAEQPTERATDDMRSLEKQNLSRQAEQPTKRARDDEKSLEKPQSDPSDEVLPERDGRPVRDQTKTEIRSISGALPITTIPSNRIHEVLDRMPKKEHIQVAKIVYADCKEAAFKFYHENSLWRTKFNSTDSRRDWRLFQLDNESFPTNADDMPLIMWIRKVQHAISRLDEPDAPPSRAIRVENEGYYLHNAADIERLLYPWGLLNPQELEMSLCYAISWCRHLNAWTCTARLEALWAALHPASMDKDWKLDLSRAEVRIV